MRATFILLLLAGGLCRALGQSWDLAVEVGVNSSGFPDTYRGPTRSLPRISPVVGASLAYQTRSGIYSSLSVRYYTIGTNLTQKREFYDDLAEVWYKFEETERYFFRKLAYGLGLGYRFRLWKKDFDVLGGYRLAFVPSGNYKYHYLLSDPTGVIVDLEKQYDPMNNPNLDQKPSKDGHEVYFGLGLRIRERFRLAIQYALPTEIIFSEFGPHNADSQHTYFANDFSLSVFFTLGKPAGDR